MPKQPNANDVAMLKAYLGYLLGALRISYGVAWKIALVAELRARGETVALPALTQRRGKIVTVASTARPCAWPASTSTP